MRRPAPILFLLLMSYASPGLAHLHAQTPPPPAERHALDELEQRRAQSGHAWLPFLDRRSLSCGLYGLPKGAEDGQPVHADDEVYFVTKGRAKLRVGEGEQAVDHDATPGSVLFVAAGVKHRFVQIEDDLSVLVFFSHAKPTRGGMAAGPVPKEQTPYDEASERGNARIFYWYADGSAGQTWIDFGRPGWNPAFGKFLTAASGRRWRFGENAWSSLDTNIPLTIGGVDLGVGQYYLVMANDAEHGVHLIALDPQVVRRAHLDAYEANKTTGGTIVPLKAMPEGPVVSRLEVALAVDRAHKDHATLTIAFGPHRYEAEVLLHP